MDWFMVAIAVLLVAVVISRFVAEAGLKCLSVEQKGELVEAFSGFRKYGLIVWVGFAVLTYKMPWLIAFGLGAYLIAYQALMVRHAKRRSLPAAYTKYSIASSVVVMLGVGVYSGFVMGWL